MKPDVNEMVVSEHFVKRWHQRFRSHDPGEAIDAARPVRYDSVIHSARITKGPKFARRHSESPTTVYLYNPDVRAIFVVRCDPVSGKMVLVTVYKQKIVA